MVSVFQDCFRRIFSYQGTGPDAPDPGAGTDPDDCIDNDPTCCAQNPNDPDCDDDTGGDDPCLDVVSLYGCGDERPCADTGCCEGNVPIIQNITRGQLNAQYGIPCDASLEGCVDIGGQKYHLDACNESCCPSKPCGFIQCAASQDGCDQTDADGCCEDYPPPFHIAQDEVCAEFEGAAEQYFGRELYLSVEQCVADGCISDETCQYWQCTALDQSENLTECTIVNPTLVDLGVTDCEDAPDEIQYNGSPAYKSKDDCNATYPCCPMPVYYQCDTESQSTKCGTCNQYTQPGSCDLVIRPDIFADQASCDAECPGTTEVYICNNPEQGFCDTVSDFCTADDPLGNGTNYFLESGACNATCCEPATYWYCPVGIEGGQCQSYVDDDCIIDSGNAGPNGERVFKTKQACEKSQQTYCCEVEPSKDNYTNINCEFNDGNCVTTGECATPDNVDVVFTDLVECSQSVLDCQDCYDEPVGQSLTEVIAARLQFAYDGGNSIETYYCPGETTRTLSISSRNALGPNLSDDPSYSNLEDFQLLINGNVIETEVVGIDLTWTYEITLTSGPFTLNYEFKDQCGTVVAAIPVNYTPVSCLDSLGSFQECLSLNSTPDHPFTYPCATDPCDSPFSSDFPECDTGGGGGGSGPIQGQGTPRDPLKDTDSAAPGILNSPGVNYLREMNRVIKTPKILDVLGNDEFVRAQSAFTPMYNDKHLTIFSDQVHASIWAVMNIDTEPEATERAFDDVSLNYIYRSLNDNLKKRIDLLEDYDGKPLRPKILRRIRILLFEGRLDEFDEQGLFSMNTVHDKTSRSNNISNENNLVDLVNRKAKPLNPDVYGGFNKERMKIWKTVATDLEKAIAYVDTDSVLRFIDIKQDDSYEILDSSGDATTKYINEGDFITYYKTDGSRGFLDLDTLIEQAVVFDFEDLRKAFGIVNEDYATVLSVSSDENSFVEEEYSLSDARQDFYFFKLEVSTLEDVSRTNPLVRISKANYKLVTDADEINEWIEYKPWPYMHFNMEASDPFFDHMLDTSNMTAEFKDISFDKIQGSTDDVPVIPRRIPWHIVLIPTDRTRFLIGSGKSKLTGYGSRKAVFRLSPDRTQTSQRWDPEIFNEKGTDFFGGVDPRQESKSIKVEYDSSKLKSVRKSYKNGSEKLPRKPSAARQLFKAIRDAKADDNNFIDEAKTRVEWGSVFKNLTPNERKTLYSDIEDYDKKRDQIATNTFATSETVRERFVQITEVFDKGLNNVDDYDPPPVKKRERAVKIEEPEGGAETPEILP